MQLAVVLSRAGAATSAPSASPESSGGRVATITGHGLLVLSETEFRFAANSGTYTVVMDLSTRCVNLRGKLLGGYQLVSRILMITSLPITITGPVDGSTIRAQTVLIPTDRDALT
ncbi:MAG: hypothetical protein HY262_01675 [Chloroflexi bacterium]|nr:hypothetical protein [Chloroflexota bacterium]